MFVFLRRALRPYFFGLLILCLCQFAWAFEGIFLEYKLSEVIDLLTNIKEPSGSLHMVYKPLAIIIIFWVFGEILFRTFDFVYAYLMPKITRSIRTDCFTNLQNQSFDYYQKHLTGDLSSRFQDFPNAIGRILAMVTQIFAPALISILCTVIILTCVYPFLGLMLLFFVAMHFATYALTLRFVNTKAKEHASMFNKLQSYVLDFILSHMTWRVFKKKQLEQTYFMDFQNRERDYHTTSLKACAYAKVAMGGLTFFVAYLGINGCGLYLWSKSKISVGTVVLLFQSVQHVVMMVWWSVMEFPNLTRDIGTSLEAFDVLNAKYDQKFPIAEIKSHPLLPSIRKGEIIFDAISFGFENTPLLFNNFSLIIHPKEHIGLVGLSGSGKTTLMHLLLGLYPLQSGRILIDGYDISHYDKDSLFEAISLIPQHPTLFNRSILDNIRYGNPCASEEEAIIYSRMAQAHDFIEKLPNHYHTIVEGQTGTKFSGGQLQRIAIARALIKKSPICIWDEATSALDSITEKLVHTTLYESLRDTTVIAIAHRFSTIQMMERIVVLDHGLLQEEGNHESLIAKKGLYHKLYTQSQKESMI